MEGSLMEGASFMRRLKGVVKEAKMRGQFTLKTSQGFLKGIFK